MSADESTSAPKNETPLFSLNDEGCKEPPPSPTDGATPFSDRLAAIVAKREKKLEEIKSKVGAMDTKDADDALLNERENVLSDLNDLHSRMKRMVADLNLPLAVNLHRWEEKNPETSSDVEKGKSLLEKRDPSDEVDSLYKHMLLAFGNWKPDDGITKTSTEKGAETKPICDKSDHFAYGGRANQEL